MTGEHEKKNGPFMHYRTGGGGAFCGLPAKQDQLADGWSAVDCPHCMKRFRQGHSK